MALDLAGAELLGRPHVLDVEAACLEAVLTMSSA